MNNGDVDANLDEVADAPTDESNTTVVNEEEETSEPEPVVPTLPELPDDLRWIGAYMPAECDALAMGSVLGVFCPGLEYLMHTQEVIDQTFVLSTNFLDAHEELRGATVYSLSHETDYNQDLILLLNGSEVWRISATHDAFGNHRIAKTKLFSILTRSSVVNIEVYDDFTIVLFDDESVFLAFRPEIEGDVARYNNAIVDPGDPRTTYLYFIDAPLQYYAVVADTSLSFSYIMNILTEDGDGNQFLSQ